VCGHSQWVPGGTDFALLGVCLVGRGLAGAVFGRDCVFCVIFRWLGDERARPSDLLFSLCDVCGHLAPHVPPFS